LRERLRDLLAERTRMLAAIAHDYRTYLTRLELRSEFIEDERQRAAAAEDLAEMRMLLADTLTFARIGSPRWRWRHLICEELQAIVKERCASGQDVGIAMAGNDAGSMSGPILIHASHVSSSACWPICWTMQCVTAEGGPCCIFGRMPNG
jgi:signal transduction histidine kinase